MGSSTNYTNCTYCRGIRAVEERQASRLPKPVGLFFLCVRREMLNVKGEIEVS